MSPSSLAYSLSRGTDSDFVSSYDFTASSSSGRRRTTSRCPERADAEMSSTCSLRLALSASKSTLEERMDPPVLWMAQSCARSTSSTSGDEVHGVAPIIPAERAAFHEPFFVQHA